MGINLLEKVFLPGFCGIYNTKELYINTFFQFRDAMSQYVDLTKLPLSYDGIAEIPQVLLLSFAGISLRRSGIDRKNLSKMASESLQAIHRLGVRHCDTFARNIFWNADSKRVVFIDFERAQIQEARPPLQVTSFNAKRKRVDAEELAKERRAACMLEDEMQNVAHTVDRLSSLLGYIVLPENFSGNETMTF
ncbi:hypothetical protein LOZ58_005319 [Ophidiomyces ophidiicola]|nr:hypothetical protein LOZ58_005319 [Ophidiomyces ophidiicola]